MPCSTHGGGEGSGRHANTSQALNIFQRNAEGGLLSGLFFIPSGRRVSYFTASGTLSVGECHLDCVVYVCSSAAFWKSLPSCISTGFQVFKLSTLQFFPSRA